MEVDLLSWLLLEVALAVVGCQTQGDRHFCSLDEVPVTVAQKMHDDATERHMERRIRPLLLPGLTSVRC